MSKQRPDLRPPSDPTFERSPVTTQRLAAPGTGGTTWLGMTAPVGTRGIPFHLLRAMRPHQWTKNAFVFAALVFDRKFFEFGPVANAILAFAAFCLASSATYLINDIRDIANDRAHPRKRFRPLASGDLSVPIAAVASAVLVVVSLTIAWLVRPEFAGVIVAYLALMAAYNLGLKLLAVLDVMIIAIGFVLRAAGGAVAIDVPISPWLYVCTALLSMFLGFAKRRSELATLGANADAHRANLADYTIPMLDQLITMVGAATIMAYALYTFDAPSVPSNYSMMLTLPFVVFAIFRYLVLIHQNRMTGSPELLLFRDRPLFAAILGWGVAAILVLYYLQ
jgi:4-hydroxybenzoate polyprenyltransferase